MDGGPYRAPQPADRRVISRPEPTRRQAEASQPEAPQQARVEQKTMHPVAPAQTTAKQKKSFKKRFILPFLAVIFVIILGFAGWFAWTNAQNAATAIDESKYQAVFFTNGQVYFGKLKSFNSGYMKLTDIFYLQTQKSGDSDSESLQETTSDQNNVQLIKLGEEIHAPEDQMIISKDQILFYENLKADGKVAQSIEKYKEAN